MPHAPLALSAQSLAMLVGAQARGGLPTATGVTFNSSRVRPGDVFFALPGERGHGIDHADEALAHGAAFIVSDREHPRGLSVADPRGALLKLAGYARSRLTGPVVAITGSAGKTSTGAFTAAALDAAAGEGNLNTPLPLACRLIAAWLAGESRPLVLELGIDHPGEMDELTSLVRPSHGLLVSIGESHLELLGGVEGVAREKSKLLRASPLRFASLAAAEHLPADMSGVTSYGLDERADVSGSLVQRAGADAGGEKTQANEETPQGGEGSTRTREEALWTGEESPRTREEEALQAGETAARYRLQALGVTVRVPYPGRAMAENALAALALARSLGLDLHGAAERIGRARLEPGRLEFKRAGARLIVDDSYNANPASIREALAVLRTLPRPHVAVLGDMLELGGHAERLHLQLGEEVEFVDQLITVGHFARHIGAAHRRATHTEDAEEAARVLLELPAGGTVLVKGSRGMRLERVVELLLEDLS